MGMLHVRSHVSSSSGVNPASSRPNTSTSRGAARRPPLLPLLPLSSLLLLLLGASAAWLDTISATRGDDSSSARLRVAPSRPATQRVKATVRCAPASAAGRSACSPARHSRYCAPLEPLRAARARWSHRGATSRRSSHSKDDAARATVPTDPGRLGHTSTTATSASRAGGSSTGSHRRCLRRPVRSLRVGGSWWWVAGQGAARRRPPAARASAPDAGRPLRPLLQHGRLGAAPAAAASAAAVHHALLAPPGARKDRVAGTGRSPQRAHCAWRPRV